MNALNVLAVSTWVVYAAVCGAEFIVYRFRRLVYPWKEVGVSAAIVTMELAVGYLIGMRLGSGLAPQGLEFPSFAWAAFAGVRFTPAFFFWLALSILIGDALFYGVHWLNHQCGIFWVYHSTHHSSGSLHFLLGIRVGVFRYLSPAYSVYLSAVLQPYFPPSVVMGGWLLVFFYQRLIHLEHFPRLGWLDRVLITPSNHRVHHAMNVGGAYNLGGITVLWDHLFGTFRAEPEHTPLVYGAGAGVPRFSPMVLQFFVLKKMIARARGAGDFRQVLRVLLGRPAN